MEDLGYGEEYLNNSYASGLAGMAIGCIFFIPAADLLGRKPVYMFASFALVLSNIGSAVFQTRVQYIVLQAIAGLAGSVNDTIIQMTVSTAGPVKEPIPSSELMRYEITDRGSFFCAPACNNEWYIFHMCGGWCKALLLRNHFISELNSLFLDISEPNPHRIYYQ